MHRPSLQMRRDRLRGKCGLSTSGDKTSCLTTGPDQFYPRGQSRHWSWASHSTGPRGVKLVLTFYARICEKLQRKLGFLGLLSSLINLLGVQPITFYNHLSLPIPTICPALDPIWKSWSILRSLERCLFLHNVKRMLWDPKPSLPVGPAASFTWWLPCSCEGQAHWRLWVCRHPVSIHNQQINSLLV